MSTGLLCHKIGRLQLCKLSTLNPSNTNIVFLFPVFPPCSVALWYLSVFRAWMSQVFVLISLTNPGSSCTRHLCWSLQIPPPHINTSQTKLASAPQPCVSAPHKLVFLSSITGSKHSLARCSSACSRPPASSPPEKNSPFRYSDALPICLSVGQVPNCCCSSICV